MDIDFDVLYTELCPIDLLLQRIGRLHRHAIHDVDRPDTLSSPMCKVFETERESIYHPYIIRRTRETLPKSILLPSDIRPLIEQVYDIDCGAAGEDKKEYEKNMMEMAIHAGDFLLPYPSECENFRGLNNGTPIMESVRYKMNTMNVFLLVRHKDGSFTCFDGRMIPDDPSSEDKVVITEQMLKLYYKEDTAKLLQSQELPKWTDDFNERFLIVDEKGNADFKKMSFNYSEYYGLRREKRLNTIFVMSLGSC